MENLKNYAKLLLGVAVLGTAVLTQSFKNEVTKVDNIHRYYSITGTSSPNLSDYVYYDEVDDLCSTNGEKVCSKQFNLGTNSPTAGQAPPTGSIAVPSSEQPGQFNEPAN
ncbi:hypothetical protein [Sphingobacterium sp.]|uniref:hypothetical protein n=1 Tax=Sphingobacterium sp. TaxID=341027 RepID=UPI0031D8824D